MKRLAHLDLLNAFLSFYFVYQGIAHGTENKSFTDMVLVNLPLWMLFGSSVHLFNTKGGGPHHYQRYAFLMSSWMIFMMIILGFDIQVALNIGGLEIGGIILSLFVSWILSFRAMKKRWKGIFATLVNSFSIFLLFIQEKVKGEKVYILENMRDVYQYIWVILIIVVLLLGLINSLSLEKGAKQETKKSEKEKSKSEKIQNMGRR
ncbi:hypothetical protein LH47_01376 [Anoxybacillus thermarum]|uniref:Uncharacterized protein n=1 Tax=Anoxybacillus thermarum TaxID=404937 RepID=A0A0D0Q963_9BACL|nr:hypothetical protein [Anoxybacillus thermarum]KIQ94498.1 hypothetical protein LH47_01376 [Anoxybacillus thermarum]